MPLMSSTRPLQVTIGPDAVAQLVEFCRRHGYRKLLLVADRNTYAAQGQAVAAALAAEGCDLKQVVFGDAEVVADASHVLDVLAVADRQERVFVAVGSGTLTDITRFSSHRTKTSFVAVPTAPSVDGFASVGAPLIIHGVKITLICHAPIAVFTDINTLAQAPRPMIAAGFADMLGKLTSVADWRIGHLLWDEPYDEAIAQRTLAAAALCTNNAAAIGAGAPDAVRILLDALLESGYCMIDFGSSRPASGAEHHYSHYWEMKLLQEGRPAILHGAKVGVATALVADFYARLRTLSRQEASGLLEASALPSRQAEVVAIRAAYGDLAGDIVAEHANFLNLDAAGYDALKRKVLAHWEEIQAIAAQVPPPETIVQWLRAVGGPATTAELGLSPAEEAAAAANGHYLRDRFTVRKLARVLGIDRAAFTT
jgi:glycerol-1-phosphate dehydrogenase [NAD(P)+]